MWYQYRKSPLGTVVRETMKVILGIYTMEEAVEELKRLQGAVSAKLKIVSIKQAIHDILSVDPDLADTIWRDSDQNRVALIADWNPLD